MEHNRLKPILDKLQGLLDWFCGKDAKLQDDIGPNDSAVNTPEQNSLHKSTDTCSSEEPQAVLILHV